MEPMGRVVFVTVFDYSVRGPLRMQTLKPKPINPKPLNRSASSSAACRDTSVELAVSSTRLPLNPKP